MAGRVRCRISGEPGAEVVFATASSSPRTARSTARTCSSPASRRSTDTWSVRRGPHGLGAGVHLQGLPIRRHRRRRQGNRARHRGDPGAHRRRTRRLVRLPGRHPHLDRPAAARTFLNNLHGIPTDTPSYEKNGWTADAHLATEALLHHFDLRTSFGKWLDDHVDAQDGRGGGPADRADAPLGPALDPAWSASLVLIAWNIYWEYGDRAYWNARVEAIAAYVDSPGVARDAGWIWPRHSWGDWLAPGPFAPEGPCPPRR